MYMSVEHLCASKRASGRLSRLLHYGTGPIMVYWAVAHYSICTSELSSIVPVQCIHVDLEVHPTDNKRVPVR